MTLEATLYDYTNDVLKKLVKAAGGPGSLTRKDDLVAYLHERLTTPESVRDLWNELPDLSKKAVASAYHHDGHFNAHAFAAQYGALPERPRSAYGWYPRELIPLDLFIHGNRLPDDLRPLLETLVPPPERFQVTGHEAAPEVAVVQEEELRLCRADTEQAGLNDLLAYLRLVGQGEIRFTSSAHRLTAASARKVLDHLVDGDFLPLSDKPRASETIRPFGLDVFTQGAGLVSTYRGELTEAGEALLHAQEPELLLEAFERWVHDGSFDELSRISGIKGMNSKDTQLTPPARRRAAVVEGLSWCPAGVWIDLDLFLRALVVWHFDVEVEQTPYSNLYTGYSSYYDYGWSGTDYERIVKGLYVQAVLWEYLGTLGALDLVYLPPGEMVLDVDDPYGYDEAYSRYDGLWSFRITPLGAYLFGQADAYQPPRPGAGQLFTIDADGTLTVREPEALAPHLRLQLERGAEPVDEGVTYRLSRERILTALEEGHPWPALADFFADYHAGPLRPEVVDWLERLHANSQLFERGGDALFVKVKRKELVDEVLADTVLGRFCSARDARTLVLPAAREARFRTRLKELGYVLRA